jgi:capsular exopolysaccharide synthesis family protein
MDLLAYFRVLKRRWLLILALTVVGGGLGYASTLLDSEAVKEPTFYKATSTLLLDPSNVSSFDQQFTNVEQVSILVTTGDVPKAVAQDLGTTETGRQLAERIVTLTNPTPSTLEITATDPDSDRSARLADAFADELVRSIDAKVLERYTTARDDITAQVASLKAQADDLLAQTRADPPPPDLDTIQKQYEATQNEYYSAYGQLQNITTTGAPESRLTKLESAASVPITKAEYESRLSLGASGQNHLRVETGSPSGTAAINVSSGSGSSIDDPVSRSVLGAFLGLLAGIALALVLDRLDHRLRTRNETEVAFGLPVLAEVPKLTRSQLKDRDVVAVRAPRSRAAEAYRAIRTSLLFQQTSLTITEQDSINGLTHGNGRDYIADGPFLDPVFEPEQQERLVIMVTSAAPREGKTNTSANLAAVFAEAGASVLIINCDFRRPTIHRLLNVDDIPRTVQSTSIPGVKIVTNVLEDPNANPSQVVAAQRQVIAAARSRFDVIILDTAPILTANDAIEVVGSADLVVLIARAEVTTSDNAERTTEILTRVEAPLGGIVLVGSSESTNDYYYYYQRGQVPSSRRRSANRATDEPYLPAPARPVSDIDAPS